MGLFDWLRGGPGGAGEDGAAGAVLERIVQLVNPRLVFARHYRRRLSPAVRNAMNYAHDLVATAVPARDASAAAWQLDPCVRAMFAAPQDIARAFSRSPDVRAWFEANPAAGELHAALSMQLVERRVLGVELDGDVLRRDVPQTTVSFTDHRARICAAGEAALREDIEGRIVDQLALMAITVAVQDASRRQALEQERALLRTRLRLLTANGAGVSGLGGSAAPAAGDAARLHAELAVNEANLARLAGGAGDLERQLEGLCAVLLAPAEHLFVSAKRIRLDSMNIMVPELRTGTWLDLQIARLPLPDAPPEHRAFVFVRFPREELLPRADIFSEATRMLH